MAIAEKIYNAKILLFGEYGIIKDSMGLSIPYDYYKGALVIPQGAVSDESARESNAHIASFARYLESLNEDPAFESHIDTEALNRDVECGLYFDSSIPCGYGAGSSGALVAAVYDRYCPARITPEGIGPQDIVRLKGILGRMESFFHGRSSGLDPLICYLNLPILVRPHGAVDPVGIPDSDTEGRGAIFLLDSGIRHSTGELIDLFFEKMKNEGFRKMLREEFNALNDACIRAFIDGRKSSLLKNVRALSQVVLTHFSPMIPGGLRKIWRNGLQTDAYYLKLCGAGGGGFVLGFTHDYDQAARMLRGYATQPIYRF